jgi:hypothetical protein
MHPSTDSSLVEHVIDAASKLYLLNLPEQSCIDNCRKRPWEPHKYLSKAEQNLKMLIKWIQDYLERVDDFPCASHRRIFDQFDGEKIELSSNRAAE